MTKLTVLILLLFATPATAQVTVAVRTEKLRFLAGEPIFVLVDVTNVGTESIGHSGKLAVPVLIDRAVGAKGYASNSVCGALMTLTHRTWCDGTADVRAMQARWRRWWKAHESTAPIYGPDDCDGRPSDPEIR